MSEQDVGGIKEVQAAFKEAVDFQTEILSILHKSHLQATQAILSGYSEAVRRAIDQCEPAPLTKPAAKK